MRSDKSDHVCVCVNKLYGNAQAKTTISQKQDLKGCKWSGEKKTTEEGRKSISQAAPMLFLVA